MKLIYFVFIILLAPGLNIALAQDQIGEENDSLQAIINDLQQRVRALENQQQEDELESLLKEAESASQEKKKTSKQKVFKSGQRSLQAINPEISVTGDMFGQAVVNDEEYRVIKWDEGIPFKLYENDRIYNTKFYEWKEFWECGEKLDYAPALPYAISNPTDLIKNTDTVKFNDDDNSFDMQDWIPSNFVFTIIPLKEDSNDWLEKLKGKTLFYYVPLNLGDHPYSGLHMSGEGIDLDGDSVRDAFWYIEKGSGNLIEWYARLYLNIDGEWIPVWFQYFNEMY